MALHGQILAILEIGEDDAYYLISKLCNSSGWCCMVIAKTPWRKRRIIFSFKTVRNFRMALHGQSLEILEIGEEDAGEFICEVETFGPPLDQVHTLEVLGENYTMEVLL
jgi:hypothetical protein